MFDILRRITAIICICACALTIFGCTMPQQQGSSEQVDSVAQNRQYMSALNQMSTELSERLAGFTDAVSRNDTVGMRTQADDAFQVISKMKEQDAPEDLVGLKDGYIEACESLESALDSYITLYEDVVSSEAPFDQAAYAERIKQIQEEYDKAAAQLEETDQMATELQK